MMEEGGGGMYYCPEQTAGGRRSTASRPVQKSPGRRTPCTGSHLHPSRARRPRKWQWKRIPCCGRSPARRKPDWNSAAGASWWQHRQNTQTVSTSILTCCYFYPAFMCSTEEEYQ